MKAGKEAHDSMKAKMWKGKRYIWTWWSKAFSEVSIIVLLEFLRSRVALTVDLELEWEGLELYVVIFWIQKVNFRS